MSKIIYILGTDGSGKTTLAKGLVEKYQSKGVKLKYLYARHIPIILYPFKLISKIILYRQNSEFTNYEKYSDIKYGFSKKHPIIARLYAAIWVIDYLIFSGIKIYWNIMLNKYIIIDRYIADVVINISIASLLTENETLRLLNFFHFLFPKPNFSFFIKVDEKIAFKRKDDIQSIKYLKERNKFYIKLQDYYKYSIVDGSLSKEQLLNTVNAQIILN